MSYGKTTLKLIWWTSSQLAACHSQSGEQSAISGICWATVDDYADRRAALPVKVDIANAERAHVRQSSLAAFGTRRHNHHSRAGDLIQSYWPCPPRRRSRARDDARPEGT